MKRLFLLVFLLLIGPLTNQGLLAQSPSGSIYQVSTMDALKRGSYSGTVSYGDLKNKGDFGIGTLHGLDGEMVALDGSFYQIRMDGKAYAIPETATSPFCNVTFFKPGIRSSLEQARTYGELRENLDRLVNCKDLPYAIKVQGVFSHAKVRSVPRQNEPYPDLESSLKHQAVFDLRNVRGTLVGFRFPDSMSGVNVAGYHFHFITADKQAGGHVLDCSGEDLSVELAPATGFLMELPKTCR